MHAGILVSDEVVNAMVEERLSQPDAAKGFVLDGYPRTLAQAQNLTAWLAQRDIHEVVIHLAVDYNVIIARLTGRRECPLCGTLYNVALRPPKVDELCDLDGEKLVRRDDDREDVIRQRLDAYERADSSGAGVFADGWPAGVRGGCRVTIRRTCVYQKIRQALEN